MQEATTFIPIPHPSLLDELLVYLYSQVNRGTMKVGLLRPISPHNTACYPLKELRHRSCFEKNSLPQFFQNRYFQSVSLHFFNVFLPEQTNMIRFPKTLTVDEMTHDMVTKLL